MGEFLKELLYSNKSKLRKRVAWNHKLLLHLKNKDFLLLVGDVLFQNYKEKSRSYTSGKWSSSIFNIHAGNEHSMWNPNLPLSYFPVICYFQYLATQSLWLWGPPRGSWCQQGKDETAVSVNMKICVKCVEAQLMRFRHFSVYAVEFVTLCL